MMRVWAVLAAAFALSACAFSAERAFFSASEAAYPIRDGALIEMREDNDDSHVEQMRFVRSAGGYDLAPIAPEEPPEKTMHLLFVAVPQTPQDDYIVQMRIEDEEDAVAFAFAWRTDDGLRLISDPRAFETLPEAHAWLESHTRRLQYGERQFAAREDVLAFHRMFIAPNFIGAAGSPEGAIDLVAIDESALPEQAN